MSENEPQKPAAYIIKGALDELKKHRDATATAWSGLNENHPFRSDAVALYETPPPVSHWMGNGERIAAALEACDWSGSPIGNKEILKAAVAELRSLQAWQRGAISCREAEEARIEEYRLAAEAAAPSPQPREEGE